MIFVEILNSCQLDLIRIYKYRHDFNEYYYNLVVAEVFKAANRPRPNEDLIIFFCDNHYCNIDNLDYKKLHRFLRKFFRTVSFVTDNVYDYCADPEVWAPAIHINANLKLFAKLSLKNLSLSRRDTLPGKMFGLHILRPDTHRLGLLVELHRQGILDNVDVRLGFRSHEFTQIEFRRSCNIDSVCFEFDICHRDLFQLIDSLPFGGRLHYRDNSCQGIEQVKKDVGKNQHSDFAIELVCASSINDHIFGFDEKIARPMILKQPFIYVASANTYKLLNYLGFQTFSHIWSESWDQYKESWLVPKIKEIAQTCKNIVDRYSINQVIELAQPQTEKNFLTVCDLQSVFDKFDYNLMMEFIPLTEEK